jgi:hypothetical protein
MLALSANRTDNLVPLPEPSRHLANLLRVITGKIEDVNTWAISFEDSAELYKLVRKYDFDACIRTWMSCLVKRFTNSNPYCCFALACENYPADRDLAHAAILSFRPSQGSSAECATAHKIHQYACFCPELSSNPKPALLQKAFIQRLGLQNYSSYVSAWDSALELHIISSGGFVKELADRFVSLVGVDAQ